LGRKLKVPPQAVSRVGFYLFSPCLLFNLLFTSDLNGSDVLRMMGFAGFIMTLVGAGAWLLGRALKLDRRMQTALMISGMFMNSGNLGLPLVKFAFGESALSHAAVYFITMIVLTNTVGVLVASLGSTGFWQAISGLLKVPVVYMAPLALLLKLQGWSLPLPLARIVEMLGNAAIPTMLVVMGLQFHAARWNGHSRALISAAGLRLLAGPALAIAISPLFGLSGAARQAGAIESAMPTAVMATILATEYDAEPAFVSYVVFTSTLLCPLTLTPLLAFLGA